MSLRLNRPYLNLLAPSDFSGGKPSRNYCENRQRNGIDVPNENTTFLAPITIHIVHLPFSHQRGRGIIKLSIALSFIFSQIEERILHNTIYEVIRIGIWILRSSKKPSCVVNINGETR